MTITTITAAELRTALVANNLQDVIVTMACNGDAVAIHPSFPYGYSKKNRNLADVVYYMVNSATLPWLGGSSLEEVAEQLNHYADYLAEKETDLAELHNIRTRLQTDYRRMTKDEWEGLFQLYSDFHKDVHGYRPRDVRRPRKFDTNYTGRCAYVYP